MLLLILEVAMLIGGMYAIFTAKVPSFLVGGGKVQVEGMAARLFGVLFILPLPVSFLGGVILALLLGEEGKAYATILELIVVFGVAILATVLSRFVGKKIEPVNDIEAKIARKAQGALMYAIFSITGFAALICCPLAIVYASQAIKLIDEHHVGEQHRNKANTARWIAIIFTTLWAAAIICLVSTMWIGSR